MARPTPCGSSSGVKCHPRTRWRARWGNESTVRTRRPKSRHPGTPCRCSLSAVLVRNHPVSQVILAWVGVRSSPRGTSRGHVTVGRWPSPAVAYGRTISRSSVSVSTPVMFPARRGARARVGKLVRVAGSDEVQRDGPAHVGGVRDDLAPQVGRHRVAVEEDDRGAGALLVVRHGPPEGRELTLWRRDHRRNGLRRIPRRLNHSRPYSSAADPGRHDRRAGRERRKPGRQSGRPDVVGGAGPA